MNTHTLNYYNEVQKYFNAWESFMHTLPTDTEHNVSINSMVSDQTTVLNDDPPTNSLTFI